MNFLTPWNLGANGINAIIFHVIPTITVSTVLDDMIIYIIGFITTVMTTVAMATVTTPATGLQTFEGMPLPLGKWYMNDTCVCSAWYLWMYCHKNLFKPSEYWLQAGTPWFLCVCVYMHVRAHASIRLSMHPCLCPRLLISSTMIWTSYDWLNKCYSWCMGIVGIIDNGHGLGVDTHHGN